MEAIYRKINALERAEKSLATLKGVVVDLQKDIEGLKDEIRELRGKENGTIENEVRIRSH